MNKLRTVNFAAQGPLDDMDSEQPRKHLRLKLSNFYLLFTSQ